MTGRDRAYWLHIQDAIESILKYTAKGKAAFEQDKMVQDATVRQLQVIGEAVKKLGDTEKSQFSNIPWRNIAGMRDKIIHDYFEIDLNLVWDVVSKNLPELQNAVKKALKRV